MVKVSYELYKLPNIITNNKLEMTKKKQKIKNEEMIIPCKTTLYLFQQYNYSLPQVKQIAKHYDLKLSGNKDAIISRIRHFLLIDNYVLILQRFVRGFIQRTYNHLHGPAYKNRQLCTNESDFYTLDPVSEIPFHQFISFKDDDGFIYGFELSSLYNLFKKNNYFDVENPYNRKMLPDNLFSKICHIVTLTKMLNININLCIEPDAPPISYEKAIELRSLELFQYINSLGNYGSNEWFLSLDMIKLIRFLRELQDIWDYRAGMTMQYKLQICPPIGNPFYGVNINNLVEVINILDVRFIALNIMENCVYRGIDDHSKNNGAIFILGALTIVNEDAGNALPWLYESFANV